LSIKQKSEKIAGIYKQPLICRLCLNSHGFVFCL
jgi:hypothetical protein